MMDNGKIIENMAKVFTHGKIGRNISEILVMVQNMVMEQ